MNTEDKQGKEGDGRIHARAWHVASNSIKDDAIVFHTTRGAWKTARTTRKFAATTPPAHTPELRNRRRRVNGAQVEKFAAS